MYSPMGYSSSPPAGFTLDRRSIYGTFMDSWWYPTADGTQTFTVLEKQPTGSNDPHLDTVTRYNDAFDGVYQSPTSGSFYTPSLLCFYDWQNYLASAPSGSYFPNAGSLCISSFPANTTVARRDRP